MRFRRRILLLYLVICTGFLLVLLRTAQMQTLDRATWEDAAEELRSHVQVLQAPRGRILDRRGRVLAHDQAVLQLAVVPYELLGRESGRCTACGLVRPWRPALMPDEETPYRSRICPCQVEALRGSGRRPTPTIEDLGPPPTYHALDRALGLEPGTLLARGLARIEEVRALAKRFRQALEASEVDVFVSTRERAFLEDMLRRPYVLESGLGDDAARLVLGDEVGAYRGFEITHDLRRRSNWGMAAPHLIGYATKVDYDELEALRKRVEGADGDTRVGRMGVERAMDEALQGKPGERVLGRDGDGSFARVLEEKAPQPGQDVTLALDVIASEEARGILLNWGTRAHYLPRAQPSGAFVMMDAETGEILVWAEIPGFDLEAGVGSLFSSLYSERTADPILEAWLPKQALPPGLDLATWQERLSAPIGAAVSRVSQIAIEPGSTFKTFVGMALLTTGHLDPAWYHTCSAAAGGPGCHGCGQVEFVRAIEKSCNKYFAHWLRQGNRRSETAARLADVGAFLPRFGFGERPSLLYPEWRPGTWLSRGYDFPVASLLPSSRMPRVQLQLAPGCPQHVGGDPSEVRGRLAEATAAVALASGSDDLRVTITAQEERDRHISLRFEVRSAAPPLWTALPVAPGSILPPAWSEDVAAGRAGLAGHPARGGAVWFTARYAKELGRTTPEATAAIHPYDASSVAIGQGPILATPLQMARGMCALANGGFLPVPQPVHAVGGRPLSVQRTDLHLDREHLLLLRDGMLAVTEGDVGTARASGFDKVPALVYGKTGTAQLGKEWRPWPDERDAEGKLVDRAWHHWFAGFAEAPGRRTVAFACVLHAREEAAASLTAARAVADILARWFDS